MRYFELINIHLSILLCHLNRQNILKEIKHKIKKEEYDEKELKAANTQQEIQCTTDFEPECRNSKQIKKEMSVNALNNLKSTKETQLGHAELEKKLSLGSNYENHGEYSPELRKENLSKIFALENLTVDNESNKGELFGLRDSKFSSWFTEEKNVEFNQHIPIDDDKFLSPRSASQFISFSSHDGSRIDENCIGDYDFDFEELRRYSLFQSPALSPSNKFESSTNLYLCKISSQ